MKIAKPLGPELPQTSTFVQANSASRQELRQFIDALRDEDFGRQLDHGWTVSTFLCHLAFWDLYMLRHLREWKISGVQLTPNNKQTINAINEAGKSIFAAVPGRDAARLALESAEAVDQELADLDDGMVTAIYSTGHIRILERSLHRIEHLRTIQAQLSNTSIIAGRVCPAIRRG